MVVGFMFNRRSILGKLNLVVMLYAAVMFICFGSYTYSKSKGDYSSEIKRTFGFCVWKPFGQPFYSVVEF